MALAPLSLAPGAAAAVRTFTPVADATVDASRPRANFGSGSSLRVDKRPAVLSYLRFQVTGVIGTVQSAQLRLFATKGSSRGFAVRRVVSNTWREQRITYGNRPAPGSVVRSSGAVSAGRWKSVDVTPVVRGNGVFSFAVTGLSRAELALASRESSRDPQLVVTFTPPLPPVNRAPTCFAAMLVTSEDIAGSVAPSCSDLDGDALTYEIAAQGTKGTASVVGGQLRYQPNANENGLDSFTYRATDGKGGTSNAVSVAVSIAPVNDAPTCANATLTVPEDTPGEQASACSDVDGGPLAPEVVSQGLKGTASVAAGKLRYEPKLNENGSDSFGYRVTDAAGAASDVATVTVTIIAVNDAPRAVDDSATTGEDAAKEIALSASDVDGQALTYAIVRPPVHGNLAPVSGNKVTYTPNPNYSGSDSFTFKANDGTADSNLATVALTVTAVNDAPTCADRSLGTPEDTSGTVPPSCSDVEGDALTFEIGAQGTKGTASVEAGDLRYQPNTNENGSDSFTYRATDGMGGVSNAATVSVTIAPVNDKPTAVSDTANVVVDGELVFDPTRNDSPGPANESGQTLTVACLRSTATAPCAATPRTTPQGGRAAIEGGKVRYTPPGDYTGSDSVAYDACDNGVPSACATAVVTLTVLPVEAVQATVETTPVPSPPDPFTEAKRDAADDPAIWVHPTAPGQSTIIGTDKQGGIGVYELDGDEIQYEPAGKINNIDLRDGFSLGGQSVSLVVGTNITTGKLVIYRVDPTSRKLVDVADPNNKKIADLAIPNAATGWKVYGLCMYRSADDKFYTFVTRENEDVTPSGLTDVEQLELEDNGSGKVETTRVRGLTVGSKTEGCVADDAEGDLYISEEDVGIWKYGAGPGDGDARTPVDRVGGAAGLTGDIEGLALVGAPDGSGYLIVSNQSSDAYAVYRREGTNAFVRNVKVVDGAAIDGTTFTDGIDASWANLGDAFPEGVFVAQDDKNFDGTTQVRQNFKLVPLDKVLGVLSPF